MVSRARSQKRMAWLKQFAAIAALLLIGGLGVGFAAKAFLFTDLGPLSCGQVVSLMKQYHNGELNADTTANVKHHLDHCWHCSTKYKALYEAEARYDSSLSEVVFAFH